MTEYTLVVHATGPSNSPSTDANVRSKDADILFRQFVRQLESEGHEILLATITTGETSMEVLDGDRNREVTKEEAGDLP